MRPVRGRDRLRLQHDLKGSEPRHPSRFTGSHLSFTFPPQPVYPSFEPYDISSPVFKASRNCMSDEDVEIVTLVDEMMSEASSPYLSSPGSSADSTTFLCGYPVDTVINPFQFPRHDVFD
ncbi:unnamed protein product [Porites evermanni]|uniref:Uncharacterized protein n=1 Tax=Porites evermanni TaxID=104178 RepID=A0ABN8T2E3_9CNID|nr:unnamed protein product [Porites evermanni]